MFGIVINEQGYRLEFVALNEDKSLQFYELKPGESVIEKDWQIANSINRAKWDFSTETWIDTDPLPPVEVLPTEPDKMEVLEKQIKQQEEAIGLIATQVAKNTLLNGGMRL